LNIQDQNQTHHEALNPPWESGGHMLKKSKKTEDDKGFAYQKFAEQETVSPIQQSETKQQETIIGEKISIEGNIRGNENLVIEGTLKGNIELEKHNFRIGPKGRVEGEVHALNVKVSGQMTGNIQTQGKVEITREADFTGDIRAKSISVEDGAYIKMSVELIKEPDRKSAPAVNSTTFPTPKSTNEPKSQTTK
jgi:cytoskeletal protein CcmA (bactofilin family)